MTAPSVTAARPGKAVGEGGGCMILDLGDDACLYVYAHVSGASWWTGFLDLTRPLLTTGQSRKRLRLVLHHGY